MNNKIKKISQVKYGAILSYALIVLNSIQGIFLAPYILGQIGDSSYGVYKTIASFSSAIMVLDLGIGTTVMRYTAKFRAEKKSEDIENFAAMGLIEATIMSIIVVCVSIGLYFYLPSFYSENFSNSEIYLAQKLFLILIANMVLVIFENVLNGVITGSNKFIFANSMKLVLLILRIFATVALLQCWKSAITLVLITLTCSIITMFAQVYYIFCRLNIRIRLRKWDMNLFKESMGYTALMFIQTIAIQVNGNLDNIVISRIIGPVAVTVYSFAVQMFNMYESLAMAFSNLMLPHVSKRISDGATDKELQNIVTKAGRMQFVVLGAALAGFICVGKEFIQLWLGKGFEDVYYLSLIMMVPVTFTLIQNVCLSILRARNMMRFRTFCLLGTTLFNLILTVIGTKIFGYYAAAIGTGSAVFVGSVVIMNIYYHKAIGFQIFRFYKDVFSKLIICVIIPFLIVTCLSQVCPVSWLSLIIKIMVFMIAYLILLWTYGLTKKEKVYLWKG